VNYQKLSCLKFYSLFKKHEFCEICIFQWFSTDKDSCPICRQVIVTSSSNIAPPNIDVEAFVIEALDFHGNFDVIKYLVSNIHL
jgi:hypothetical protein